MIKSLFSGICLFLLAVPSWSQIKVGYINYDKIWTHAVPFVKAKERMESEFYPRDQKLKEMEKTLIERRKQFDKTAATLSETDRRQKNRELLDAEREFQRSVREFHEDFNQRQNEEITAGMDVIAKVVQQLAESEHYDLILQDAVYVNPSLDLTDRILNLLDKAK